MECEESRSVRGGGECRLQAACELEAAEVLAGFIRRSPSRPVDLRSVDLNRRLFSETAAPSDGAVQDQKESSQRLSDSTVTSRLEKGNQVGGNVPANLCSAGRRSSKLTEAEREARRMHRVLANRESARQTIRRRQAVLEDLTRKAADLLEENVNLKKTKELALKQFHSLKDRNVSLKDTLAKERRPRSGEKEENPKVPDSSSTPRKTTSFSTCQPYVVPPYCPTVHPTSTGFLQYPFLIPPTPIQQEHGESAGFSNPGSALVYLPVTCFLPVVAHRSADHSEKAFECTAHSSPGTMREGGSFNHLPLSQKGEGSGSMRRHASICDSQSRRGKAEISADRWSAASKARWRRKELMKLRNPPHQ